MLGAEKFPAPAPETSQTDLPSTSEAAVDLSLQIEPVRSRPIGAERRRFRRLLGYYLQTTRSQRASIRSMNLQQSTRRRDRRCGCRRGHRSCR